MCGCEWNYTCPKCEGVTEHDDFHADFGPEALTYSDLLTFDPQIGGSWRDDVPLPRIVP